jgi:hypothetical protein
VRIAIAQPTYLPWLGYFDLIDQVDKLVLLDNVQFEKQSWQQRNRIKTPTGLQWLTIPVVFRGRLGQQIREVEIREPEFWRDHVRALELSYRRAPFFDCYFPPICELLRSSAAHRRLAELTTTMVCWFAESLGISTPMVRASELPVEGKRTALLAQICSVLGATEYLSPLGSAEYLLAEQTVLTDQGVQVEFHHYEHPCYSQLFPPFVPYACVLDLLMNEGNEAGKIVRGGRRMPFAAAEAALLVSQKAHS